MQKPKVGPGATCKIAVTRTASRIAPIGTAAVLACDRRGILERGGSPKSWGIAAGRDEMVSGVWRNAPIAFGTVGTAAERTVFVADGARADCVVASSR